MGAIAFLEVASSAARRQQHYTAIALPNAGQSTFEALLSIAKSTRAFYGIKLAQIGFYNGQDELLLAIHQTGVMASEMADHLMVRPSTVSKMMDRLVERGLVERIRDHRDARRTLVGITSAGMEARELVVQMRNEVDVEFTKALNAGSPCSDEGKPTTADHLTDCATALARQLRRLR